MGEEGGVDLCGISMHQDPTPIPSPLFLTLLRPVPAKLLLQIQGDSGQQLLQSKGIAVPIP